MPNSIGFNVFMLFVFCSIFPPPSCGSFDRKGLFSGGPKKRYTETEETQVSLPRQTIPCIRLTLLFLPKGFNNRELMQQQEQQMQSRLYLI